MCLFNCYGILRNLKVCICVYKLLCVKNEQITPICKEEISECYLDPEYDFFVKETPLAEEMKKNVVNHDPETAAPTPVSENASPAQDAKQPSIGSNKSN